MSKFIIHTYIHVRCTRAWRCGLRSCVSAGGGAGGLRAVVLRPAVLLGSPTAAMASRNGGFSVVVWSEVEVCWRPHGDAADDGWFGYLLVVPWWTGGVVGGVQASERQ
jgi:hypothetical protein